MTKHAHNPHPSPQRPDPPRPQFPTQKPFHPPSRTCITLCPAHLHRTTPNAESENAIHIDHPCPLKPWTLIPAYTKCEGTSCQPFLRCSVRSLPLSHRRLMLRVRVRSFSSESGRRSGYDANERFCTALMSAVRVCMVQKGVGRWDDGALFFFFLAPESTFLKPYVLRVSPA